MAAIQAKYALLLIVLLSWALPFGVPELPNYSNMLSQGKVFYEDYQQWNVVNINDKALVDCYNKALDSKDMCECEVIQKANLVTFHYDPIYHGLNACRLPLLYTFLIVAILLFLEFICKLGFLVYLRINSYQIRQTIEGTTFYMLYPNLSYELPLSAFSLWNHYIVWSPLLDTLDGKEREAVLLHELTHLRQRDTWHQLLLQITKIFWWCSPVFYFINKEMHRLVEFVADEAAARKMGDARAYARLLLKIKESQQNTRKPYLAQALAKSLLKNRVMHLITASKHKNMHPLRFITAMFFLIALLWGTASFTLPEIQKQDLKIKQYKLLETENLKTGNDVFCKSCLEQQRNH